MTTNDGLDLGAMKNSLARIIAVYSSILCVHIDRVIFEQCIGRYSILGTELDGIICQASSHVDTNVYQVILILPIFLFQYIFHSHCRKYFSILSHFPSCYLNIARWLDSSARWNWNNFNEKSIEKQLIFFFLLSTSTESIFQIDFVWASSVSKWKVPSSNVFDRKNF